MIKAKKAFIPPSNVNKVTTRDRVIPKAMRVPISFRRRKIDNICELNMPIPANANRIIYIICAPGSSASIMASISRMR